MISNSVTIRGSIETPPTSSLRTPRSFSVFPESALAGSVFGRFEAIAKQFADRLALIDFDRQITFAELNSSANRLARHIVDRCGDGPGQVALLLNSGEPIIVGILAALKAGKTAVPIDATYPASRQAFIVENAEASLIIADRATISRCRELEVKSSSVVNADELPDGLPETNLDLIVSNTSQCYLLYTSGSTGQPKGIIHTHRNVLHNCLSYTNTLKISAEDRISHLHSTSFSAGLTEVLWGLLNGATVCIWDMRSRGFAGLREWIAEQRISLLHWVPTVFRQLLPVSTPNDHDRQAFPDVRIVMLGSEPVTRRDVDAWKANFPKSSTFVCRLGSTEANNFRMYFVDESTRFEGSVVPVGYPFAGKEILILDEAGVVVGPDTVGEIAIRGDYLSPGYWKLPELTARSFISDPEGGDKRVFRSGDLGVLRADGLLEFMGRKDSQLKIHGQRVEATEIESALAAVSGVQEAAVTAHVDSLGASYLVGYVVPRNGFVPATEALREAVASRLPATLVPSCFMILPQLPLTTSGKLDRKALPVPPDRAEACSDGPIAIDSTLEEVTRIVVGIVGKTELMTETNLLHLGATSIEMVRILNSIECRFGIRPAIDEFYRNPTIATLNTAIASRARKLAIAADRGEAKAIADAPSLNSNRLSGGAEPVEMEFEEGAL